MNHKKAKYRIYDYLKDELEASEKAGLELHLSECPQCRNLLDELKTLQAALQLKMEGPPAGLLAKIKTKAIVSDSERQTRKAPWRLVFVYPVFKAAIPVAAAALILIGLFLTRNLMTAPKPIEKAKLNDFLYETYAAYSLNEDEDYHAQYYMNEIGL